MKHTRLLPLVAAAFGMLALQAREVPGLPHSNTQPGGFSQVGSLRAAPCAPATAISELDLNNVRARIENGGTLWENRALGKAAYEVPKTFDNNGPNALFAGALWMGGLSPDSILKLAAVRFRQVGNDYYPGPLTAFDTITHTGDASTDAIQCNKYDKMFKTMRVDAAKQSAYYTCLANPDCNTNVDFPGYSTPAYFFNWPANGDPSVGQDYNLAPYFDAPGSEQDVYDPENGDYPGYDLQGIIDCKSKKRTDAIPLFGDQNIWWVFNDKGNAHTESGGQPIGMEIRAQAFEFSTNDEVNNMSFYNYVLINQGTQTLYKTYFGQWVDVDLGGANDDYVGCDVKRGLGYGYNGDPVDEDFQGNPGYGGPNPPPPAVGVDFFEGPYQDADNFDNPLTTDCQIARDQGGIPYSGIGIGYGDGVPDNERFGMRAFVYHNNTGGPTGDPSSAIAYYNFLRGIWGDNTPMTYGGTGYSPGGGGIRANYMFPGVSDEVGWGTGCVPQPNWDEVTAGNAPADRRFIQSAGPFTLEPGQFNNITVGVVWARASTGNVQSSVTAMLRADDKAQSLFDNCFKILNGPDAPDLTIQELDKELILYISNPQGSNNFNEDYSELDATIPATDTAGVPNNRLYRFQGYQIFQLKNGDVKADQLLDPDYARLVAQVDVRDTVGQLINWYQDPALGVAVPKEMVNGQDTGIVHSFRIRSDKFTLSDPSLKNFQSYYFMAIAYGYNNYQDFEQNIQGATGQPYPYLAGRKSPTGSIRAVLGIPHKAEIENGGTTINAQYGDGFQITRIEGQGNGGQRIELQPSTLDGILASPDSRLDELKYTQGLGPVGIKVVDPLKVPNGNFELWIKDTTSIPIPTAPITYKRLQDAYWMLVHLTDNPTSADTVYSTRSIQVQNEDIIPQWGISITITQTLYTAERFTNFLGSAKQVSSPDWYAGIPDAEGELIQNWIRAGQSVDDVLDYPDYPGVDPDQQYEKVLGGTWAPWQLVGDTLVQPGALETIIRNTQTNTNIKDIPSIQVVFTQDKSKWTRCIVVEESDAPQFTIPANTKKLHLRERPSVDKNGRAAGTSGANDTEANLVNATGMSWFPGYAVDAETGERLNMFFGENSFLGGGIGNDMLWNPTDQLYNNGLSPVFGGQHWIYVCYNVRRITPAALALNRMPQYDQGAFARQAMSSSTTIPNVYGAVGWVGSGLLNPGMSMKSPEDGLVPSELRLRMDVNKPYNLYADPYPGYEPSINPQRNGGLPLYSFNTGDRSPVSNVTEVGQNGLELIGVVPNPYYAYSGYETGRLDNRVKFINLPRTCTVSIYTVSGTLVRKYSKDNELTYLDWDLKNNYNVPISGGTYLIHVNAPGLGERVIKWFGVIRPIDLQNF
ncbi:MAG: T9SS C-terminal target domain-containing protein [Flavobacteriales bacterium]|nr:T9SS C-terminal target domain-containing protein [Flavobacteriales bacterium]